MPRVPRYKKGDIGVFHVYCRGNNKKIIFHDNDDQMRFMMILKEVVMDNEISLYHYVLMPNHYHLVFDTKKGGDMSAFMQRINHKYSIWHKHKYGGCGHLWQGRFKDRSVDNDIYLLTCGVYVELNAVRGGICDRLEDYPWSSYRFYACGEHNDLLTHSPAYLALGRDKRQRQAVYRDRVKQWLTHQILPQSRTACTKA